jgi:hypothetical protein
VPGHNHYSWCACGWCSGGWGGGGSRPYVAAPPVWAAGTRTSWDAGDFCRSTNCPICGASVYFVRHNGGSVWFDELGPPWPKHVCFDDDYTAQRLRTALADATRGPVSKVFGVVSETEVVVPGESGRIAVSCSDGSLAENDFNTDWDLVSLAGALVLIARQDAQTGGYELRRVSSSSYNGWRCPPTLASGARLVFEGRQYVFTGHYWCSWPDQTVVSTGLQQRLELEVARLLRGVT